MLCSPSSWVTQYLHPYELLVVGLFTCTSPWLFHAHPMTEWSFMLLSIGLSVDAHVGYDLPLSPHRWAPFCMGGSVKHDMHHQRPLTNFQPFFTWFDRLLGTECPGQRAAGYRPPSLRDWDKKQRRATAETDGDAPTTGTQLTTDMVVSGCLMDRWADNGAVVEAKRL